MLEISKWKFFIVLSICFLGIYYLVPNFYNKTEVTGLPGYISKKQVNIYKFNKLQVTINSPEELKHARLNYKKYFTL